MNRKRRSAPSLHRFQSCPAFLAFAAGITTLSLVLCCASPLAAQQLQLELAPGKSSLAAEVDATAHTFTAEVTQFTAMLSIDRDTGLPADGRLRFDFRNVTTGNDRRDREMLEWLEHSRFPVAEIRLISLERVTGAPDRFVAHCRMDMHGQENDLTASVTAIRRSDSTWVIEGETTVDHRRWGLPKIRRFLFLTVDPLLKVRFRLHFQPSA